MKIINFKCTPIEPKEGFDAIVYFDYKKYFWSKPVKAIGFKSIDDTFYEFKTGDQYNWEINEELKTLYQNLLHFEETNKRKNTLNKIYYEL